MTARCAYDSLANMSDRVNPCLECGACCAHYRASFYWAEADEASPGGVPIGLTRKLDDFRLVMEGTHKIPPRCVALEGAIGQQVRCLIYERRSSVCRDFEPSWANGVPNPRCDAARKAWGLCPLTPDTWTRPGRFPRAA